MRPITLVLIGCMTLAAQGPRKSTIGQAGSRDVTLVTPSLGYLIGNDGKDIRPVLGLRAFPGIGSALLLPEASQRVVLSPDQRYALLQSSDGRWSVLSVQNAQSPVAAELGSLGEKAEVAVLSPSGTSAAFYHADRRQVEVVAGLPNGARRVFATDVPGDDAPASLAINDAADLVLAGIPQAGAGSVVALRSKSPAATILRTGDPSAIVFRKDGSGAIVTDRTLNQLISVTFRGEGQDIQILAGADAKLSLPVAVAVDDESALILVVNGGTQTVLALPLAGGAGVLLECPFAASRITMLREKQVYAVTSQDGRAAGLIRFDGGEPRISFLPAVD